MRKIYKIILIIELIILFIFMIGYAIYEDDYVSKESYEGIRQPVISPVVEPCSDITFNFEINESLIN